MNANDCLVRGESRRADCGAYGDEPVSQEPFKGQPVRWRVKPGPDRHLGRHETVRCFLASLSVDELSGAAAIDPTKVDHRTPAAVGPVKDGALATSAPR